MDPDAQLQLLRRAQGGDASAFNSLLRKYFPSVRRFAYSFAQDWAEADDLAQDALLRVFKSLDQFRGESAFSTWVFRIVRNTYIDRTRTRWFKMRKFSKPDDSLKTQSSPDETPEALSIKESDRRLLWSAIRALPAKHSNVIVLVDIEGMDYQEVAAIEGIPVGTVRSRLSRGRSLLTQKLMRSPTYANDQNNRLTRRSG